MNVLTLLYQLFCTGLHGATRCGAMLFFFLPLFVAPSAQAAYTQNIVPQTAWQTVSTNWAAGDDSQTQVPIGFAFNFNGVNYTNVFLNSNGVLSFTAGFTAFNNIALPNTTPNNAIFAYWDDLDRSVGGTITYGTVGTAPNREFIVSWNAVALYGIAYPATSCTFQVVLGEDNSIRFRYSTTSVGCAGASATTGVQESTTAFIQRSFNSTIPLPLNQDVLYLRTGTVSVQKTATILCDPINGATNPKSLPGSIARWTISVTNNGTVSARLTQLVDPISNLTGFDPNLVLGASAATCATAPPGVPENGSGRAFKITLAGGTRTGFPKFMTVVADGDGATFTAPDTVTIDFLTALPAVTGYAAGELKPNETVNISFNIRLN
jgi:uncharacterized repeat protein (TIGR01451 family)